MIALLFPHTETLLTKSESPQIFEYLFKKNKK